VSLACSLHVLIFTSVHPTPSGQLSYGYVYRYAALIICRSISSRGADQKVFISSSACSPLFGSGVITKKWHSTSKNLSTVAMYKHSREGPTLYSYSTTSAPARCTVVGKLVPQPSC